MKLKQPLSLMMVVALIAAGHGFTGNSAMAGPYDDQPYQQSLYGNQQSQNHIRTPASTNPFGSTSSRNISPNSGGLGTAVKKKRSTRISQRLESCAGG